MPNYRFSHKPGIKKVDRSVSVRVVPAVTQKKHTINIVTRRNRPSCIVAPPQPIKSQKRIDVSTPVVEHIIDKRLQIHKNPAKVSQLQNEDPRIQYKRRPAVKRGNFERDLASKKSSALKHKHNALLSQFAEHIKNMKAFGKGRFLIIIACGPSILEANLPALKNHPKIDMMSVNRPDMRVWPTKFWHFCDMTQYRRNSGIWEAYDGIVINPSSIKVRHKNQILIKNISGKGYSNDLMNGYYIGRSTTYASMQLATYMQYEKIFIFGCDMSAVNGILHHYGQNPDVDNENRKQRFSKEATFYQFAADNLHDAKRKNIFFVSTYNPWPFVGNFQRLDHKIAHKEIIAMAEKL